MCQNLRFMTKEKKIQISQDTILVFGGVYSNLQALEALKSVATTKGFSPENIICTGDLIAYCAEPEACVQLIKDWGIHVIAGNVELNIRQGLDDCGCNFNEGGRCDLLSKQWYPFAKASLSKDSLEFISHLPEFLRFTVGGKSCLVVHGSYTDTSHFVFKSTPWEIKQRQFDLADVDTIIGGHCGLPFEDSKDGKQWFNPGVIGMPANDGTSRVWYGLIDADQGIISQSLVPLNYDHQKAAHLMKSAGLPQSYAATLETGLWDNCEILPETETALRGIIIQ